MSPRPGDARSVPDRRPQGFLLSPHCSRGVFANNAGSPDTERAAVPAQSINRTRYGLRPPRAGQVEGSATVHLGGNTGSE
jgi:hypothetical protein